MTRNLQAEQAQMQSDHEAPSGPVYDHREAFIADRDPGDETLFDPLADVSPALRGHCQDNVPHVPQMVREFYGDDEVTAALAGPWGRVAAAAA